MAVFDREGFEMVAKEFNGHTGGPACCYEYVYISRDSNLLLV